MDRLLHWSFAGVMVDHSVRHSVASSRAVSVRSLQLALCGGAAVLLCLCLALIFRAAGEGVQPLELMSVRAVTPEVAAATPAVELIEVEAEAPPAAAEDIPAQTSAAPAMIDSDPQHSAAELAEPIVSAHPSFAGRPIRKVRTVRMRVTAYSPDAQSCGKWADGRTASGYSVWTNGMKLVAADTKLLPFGSIVTVPGYHEGKPVPVLDRGGKIKGHRLDVLYPTHEEALQWGNQHLDVDVWEYADE